MNYGILTENMNRVINRISELGGDTDKLALGEKCDELSIKRLESSLQIKLPTQFKQLISEYAGDIKMYWSLPEDMELPNNLFEICFSEVNIGIESVENAEESRREWISECFQNSDDEYDSVWHGKLGFMTVSNGDVIAFDIKADEKNPPVVYLSHDDGDLHGCILGEDLEDFLVKWSVLGCPGPEEWHLTPFIIDGESGLQIDNQNAKDWLSIIHP